MLSDFILNKITYSKILAYFDANRELSEPTFNANVW